jgi:hypothetical protein
MNDELLTSIRKAATTRQTVRPLLPDEAAATAAETAGRYVRDPRLTWWWTAIAVPFATLPYADRNALSLIGELLGLTTAPKIPEGTLFVTDDSPQPWPAFVGPVSELLLLIAEQPYFEYFLVDPCLEWVVFDTHHNELVVVGSLRERALMLASPRPASDRS